MNPPRKRGRYAPTPPAWLRAAQREWSPRERGAVLRWYAEAEDLRQLARSVGVSLQLLKRRAAGLGLTRALPDFPAGASDHPVQRWSRARPGDARTREILSRRPPLDRAWS